MDRRLAMLAGVLGFTAVALGALGAHGVKTMLAGAADAAQRLGWWDTGSRYHLFHAFAVGLAAVLAPHVGGRAPRLAAWLFTGGVVLFSGSLYLMTLTGTRAIPVVIATPLGGITMMTGWVIFTLAARHLGEKRAPAQERS